MEAAAPTSLLVKIAAISVTAVSLAGVGVLTGILPMPGQSSRPAATTQAEGAAPPTNLASAPALTPPAPAAPTTAAAPETAPPDKATGAMLPPPPPRKSHKPTHIAASSNPTASSERGQQRTSPPEGAGVYTEPPRPTGPAAPTCRDCGVIENVQEVDQKGQGTGLGAIAGGVLGGLLGSQIGAGHGKDVAAVAGVVGGAYAGHQVEKNVRTTKQYQTTVRFDDGSSRVFTDSTVPAWKIGEHVRVENGAIVAR